MKKVGETRNETFKREVTQIYTAATYVDELGSIDQDHPPTLMCVVEEHERSNGDLNRIGMVIVCPTTGEVTYDEFQGMWVWQSLAHRTYSKVLDNRTRSELEVCRASVSDYLSFSGMNRIVSCTQDHMSSYFLRAVSRRQQNGSSHITQSELIVMSIEPNSSLSQSP